MKPLETKPLARCKEPQETSLGAVRGEGVFVQVL